MCFVGDADSERLVPIDDADGAGHGRSDLIRVHPEEGRGLADRESFTVVEGQHGSILGIEVCRHSGRSSPHRIPLWKSAWHDVSPYDANVRWVPRTGESRNRGAGSSVIRHERPFALRHALPCPQRPGRGPSDVAHPWTTRPPGPIPRRSATLPKSPTASLHTSLWTSTQVESAPDLSDEFPLVGGHPTTVPILSTGRRSAMATTAITDPSTRMARGSSRTPTRLIAVSRSSSAASATRSRTLGN